MAAVYLVLHAVAAHFQVSPRTITNWHSMGYISAFRGTDNKLFYSIDEIEHALHVRPRSQMRDGRRRGRGRIGILPSTAEAGDR